MSDAGDFDDFSDDGFEDFDIDEEEEEELDKEINSEEEIDSEDEELAFGDISDTKQYKSVVFDEKAVHVKAQKKKVADSLRKTRNVVDKYEYAKCLALRTQQIANGQIPLITVPESMTESRDIAHYELRQGKPPYIIVRYLHHAGIGEVEEWWKLQELIIPQYDF